MSTSIVTETNIPTAPPDSVSLTFSELIEQLNAQTSPPSLEQIGSWMANVEITSLDVEPYVGFKEGNYWRHRVCRNEAVEMLIICWRPGQKTPIHDHNGSHGVVRVHQGLLWETTFSYEEERGLCYDTGRECPTGTVTGADVPDIHQLGNPEVSGQDLITVHVYAPPLGVLNTYKVGSSKIDLYTPNDFPT
ncbi:MAG TPA: cysteine dioxygenase family protein [Pyrinomonadaceae bacterium]|nr:cysteine dioxygenase family protein [Pyrinomonadaceae bacterium]